MALGKVKKLSRFLLYNFFIICLTNIQCLQGSVNTKPSSNRFSSRFNENNRFLGPEYEVHGYNDYRKKIFQPSTKNKNADFFSDNRVNKITAFEPLASERKFGFFSETSSNYLSYGLKPKKDDCLPLQPPVNGIKQCKMSGTVRICEISCLKNYEFPDGSTTLTMKCNSRTGNWVPKNTFQACKLSGRQRIQSIYPRQNNIQSLCIEPKPPLNGVINCSVSYIKRTCQISCFAGYIFPDKSRQIVISCSKLDGRWSPNVDLKSCQPKKIFQANVPIYKFKKGSLLSSSRRNHQLAQAKPNKELCEKPVAPKNGKTRCVSSDKVLLCSATCHDNYEFKHSFMEVSIKCDKLTGEWEPDSEFPECLPTCYPPCRNGSQCKKQNTCLCPIGYSGKRCGIASKSLRSSLNQISHQKFSGK